MDFFSILKIILQNNKFLLLFYIFVQTNPNVDKNLFKNNSVIGLRDPSKSFPIGTDVGVLKWRFQTQEETEIPLTSRYRKEKRKEEDEEVHILNFNEYFLF